MINNLMLYTLGKNGTFLRQKSRIFFGGGGGGVQVGRLKVYCRSSEYVALKAHGVTSSQVFYSTGV